ncbi:MAG: hypothetical protein PHV33_07745 [Elusimicrobiales bacterium]|nr:hypothetical protein [Elusimicrobiales bacterium]
MIKKLVLLTFLALLSVPLVFKGMSWYTPDAARAEMVAPPGFLTPEVVDGMRNAREYVYKDAKGNIGASPALRSDDFAAKERIEVDYKRLGAGLYFYNYLRHYYLCAGDPDETGVMAAFATMKPAKLDFNPHYYVYGNLYIFPMAAYIKAAGLLKQLNLTSDMSYYFSNPGEMGKIYIAARSYGAVVGLVALAVLGLFILRTTGSLALAGLALGFILSSPILVLISKLIKPHFAVMLPATGVLIMTHEYLRLRSAKYLYWAMAMCGLAGSMVINTSVILLLPLLACRLTDYKRVFKGLLIFAVVMLACSPYWWVNLTETLADYKIVAAMAKGSTIYGLINFWYLAKYGLGPAAAALFVFSAAAALLRYRKLSDFQKVLLKFLLATTLLSSGAIAIPSTSRWVLFMLPLYLYFSVIVLNEHRRFIPVFACLLPFAVWNAARYATYCTSDARPQTSTRMQAGAWVNSAIPGASIGTLYDLVPWSFPPIRLADHRLLVYNGIQHLFADKTPPDYMLLIGPQEAYFTPEHRLEFSRRYALEKEFSHVPELMTESWRLNEANLTVKAYRRTAVKPG